MKKDDFFVWSVFSFLFTALLLPCFNVALAGNVRTISMNEKKMIPINLRMGRSTVLIFKEKTKRVVIGNQNYYKLEFIEGTDHVTLQPQDTVSTNLFVYGEKNLYGFILNTRRTGNYDDKVNVNWSYGKRKKRIKVKLIKINNLKRKGLDFNMKLKNNLIHIKINAITKLKKNFYIIDGDIFNLSKGENNLSTLKVAITRGGNKIGNLKMFLDKMKLKAKGRTKLRIFLGNDKLKGFTLSFKLGNEKTKKVIARGNL